MAGLATVNSYRRVLIKKRAALIRVAFQTRLLILQTRIHHLRAASHLPGRSIRAVWIVAIRTRHESLIDPVLKGLRKLGPHVIVATVAHLGLAFGEQVPVGLRLVDRMAGGANDIRLCVTAALNVGAFKVFGMAPKTGIKDLIRSQIRERDDTLLSTLRLDVCLAGPVATLATRVLYRNIRGNVGLVMWISKELERDVRVAGPAGAAPRIAILRGRFRGRLAERRVGSAQNNQDQNPHIVP